MRAMGYALLKTLHLLAIIVWIGGMYFAHFCLRPALAALDPPVRLKLMHAVLGRFFAAVSVAAITAFVTGVWMIGHVARRERGVGDSFHLPLDWWPMVLLGTLMVVIFGYVRLALYPRLGRAMKAEQWPAAASALAGIRQWVGVNLALGLFIVAVVVFF